MDKPSTIRDLVRKIAGAEKPRLHFRLMEVVSVEGDTCRAKLSDFEIPDIRLSSIAGGSESGLLITPATGSIVLVADLSCGELRELNVIGYSEIDSVRFHQGKTTLSADAQGVDIAVGESSARLTDSGIEFNGGTNDGLVNVRGLLDKINALERELNELKNLLAGWQPIPQDGGSALKVSVTAWATRQIQPTQKAELEDPKVKH